MKGIFISYRHEGGFEAAQHLAHLLTEDGYKVFFDKKSMRSGKYPEQLYLNIDNCCDFILILDPNVFNPTIKNGIQIQKDDWVAIELAYAIKKEKNIIPVKLPGFSEPDETKLPEEIRSVFLYQSPLYSKVYYDEGFYNSLINTLVTSTPIKKRASKSKWPFLLLILAGFIGYYLGIMGDTPKRKDIISPPNSIDTSSLLVIMGGGSVSNYIKNNSKTRFDLSDDSNRYHRSYKYIYLPTASRKAWSQIGELRSVPLIDPNHYQYHLVLLSAKKADPKEMIPELEQQANFIKERGYVEEIKVGQNQLQIAIKEGTVDKDGTSIDKYLTRINEKAVITIDKLIQFIRNAPSNLVIYSTNKESGTYCKYDSLFIAHSFGMDSIKNWTPFIDGQGKIDYSQKDPYIILEVDTYYGKNNADNIKRYDVYDENSKNGLTNDLYIYFVVFKDHERYIIPEIIRSFLKDIGIEMPENHSDSINGKQNDALILNKAPRKNELIQSAQK